jgi:uncharacterized protein with PQ loop repeat
MALSVSIQSWDDLAVGAGYLGAALGVSMVVPQIARTLRDRARVGVSPLTWALTALSCLTWLLYGLRTDEAPQVPGNVLIVTGSVLIVLLVPARHRVRTRAAALAGLAAVLVTLAVVLPATALGFVAFGIGLTSAVPQTIKSLAGRHRHDASGVSILAWLLRAASQVAWLMYAIARHDVVVSVSAAVILASALLLVGTERHRQRERSVDAGLTERRVEDVEPGVELVVADGERRGDAEDATHAGQLHDVHV